MYDLHQRSWIAISLSTIGCGFIAPALAQPHPLASVVTSQPTDKAPKNNSVSTTPLDAVLANVRPKIPLSTKAKRLHHQANVRAAQVKKDRSLQGISHLTDADRNAPKVNVTAVDRLIK
jgi:hypothetical protein